MTLQYKMPPKPIINFSEISNELHKQTTTNYPTRRVIVNDIDEIWCLDIVQMPIEWKVDNDNKTLILSVIDCFSKYAWLVVLDNKQAQTVINALLNIFKTSKRIPQKIWCDNGSEFINAQFKKQILTKYDISMYHTYNTFHCSIVERFNRTMKNWTFKAMDANNTKNWIDLLPALINTYNSKRHSSIKMTPIEASKPVNRDKVHNTLYNKMYNDLLNDEPEKAKFKVNDIVRISRKKEIFEKEGDQTYTNEIFQVREVLNTTPITYKLSEMTIPIKHMRPKKETYKTKPMDGSFYSEELQITNEPDYYKVEDIIETKTIKGIKYSLVKFVGWSNDYNFYIPTKELKEVK